MTKQLTLELMNSSNTDQVRTENEGLIQKFKRRTRPNRTLIAICQQSKTYKPKTEDKFEYAEEIEEEETLSLIEKELERSKST